MNFKNSIYFVQKKIAWVCLYNKYAETTGDVLIYTQNSFPKISPSSWVAGPQPLLGSFTSLVQGFSRSEVSLQYTFIPPLRHPSSHVDTRPRDPHRSFSVSLTAWLPLFLWTMFLTQCAVGSHLPLASGRPRLGPPPPESVHPAYVKVGCRVVC